MYNKKGALELSVTAIVILIIAIVMLGLGLGFIRVMFGRVTTSMEEQVAAEPEPPEPSGSEPITLSRESLIVHSGDPVALKVGVHNSGNVDWNKANITINCSGTGGTSIVSNEQINSKALNSGESFMGTYLFVVGKVSEGKYLCQAKIIHDPKDGPNATKDMIIDVRK